MLQLSEQHLDVLQLAGLFPVGDQQHAGFAVGGVTLDDFFQLALGRLYFVLGVQGGGQVIAIILVVRRKLHRLGQAEQGVGALAMVQQPHAQGMLQVGRLRMRRQLPGQQLARLVGLALFLTFFIMWPTFQQINEDAIQPLDNGDITIEEAYKAAETPIRDFMYGQTQEKDLHLFMDIDGEDYPDQMTLELYYDVPMTTVIPAFIISELRYAFIMGFLIYIPFIVIDMVVASVLMSMGMMMLPPTTISLPFKILLFILADGWNLVIGSVVKTFY